MIGLIVLIVGAIYLALLVWVTRGAYRWAKREGLSKTKCWLTAAVAFLAVYLPVFWDHIPTLVTYQYSCATEAGFWEYKSIDQWKKENPGVAATLVAPPRMSTNRQGNMKNYTDTIALNQRFNWIRKKAGPLPVNRWRWEYELVDSKTGEVLGRSIDFSAGNGFVGGSIEGRFWLQIGFCEDGGVYAARLGQLRGAAKDVGGME